MAGGVATGSSYIRSGIKVCQQCSSYLAKTSSLLESSYSEAGSGWKDEKYNQLGRIVGDCCNALEKPIQSLEHANEILNKLLKAVTDYESQSL